MHNTTNRLKLSEIIITPSQLTYYLRAMTIKIAQYESKYEPDTRSRLKNYRQTKSSEATRPAHSTASNKNGRLRESAWEWARQELKAEERNKYFGEEVLCNDLNMVHISFNIIHILFTYNSNIIHISFTYYSHTVQILFTYH